MGVGTLEEEDGREETRGIGGLTVTTISLKLVRGTVKVDNSEADCEKERELDIKVE